MFSSELSFKKLKWLQETELELVAVAEGQGQKTQNLRMASITLAHNGVLVTRNLQDFKKVPTLLIQDWSI